MSKPALIEGGLVFDDRGEVRFVNGFRFDGVKRFYVVSNHQQGFVRAWHGHRREAKYVFVSRGSAIVGAVEIDDWEKPSRTSQVHRFVFSAAKPVILHIPPGYANGFKSLEADTQLIFFSSSAIEESRDDDVRYDSRYWDIWTVEER